MAIRFVDKGPEDAGERAKPKKAAPEAGQKSEAAPWGEVLWRHLDAKFPVSGENPRG